MIYISRIANFTTKTGFTIHRTTHALNWNVHQHSLETEKLTFSVNPYKVQM